MAARHALSTDDCGSFTPPPNYRWFEYPTRTETTARVGRGDNCFRVSARQYSPNHNPSRAGSRFRKKEQPLSVASASAPARAARGRDARYTRHRTAAIRAGRASRIRQVPAARGPAGKNRDQHHAASGPSVARGSGGYPSESGLPSSHPRKAAIADAVNRSRPLSALANVCLDNPRASIKRDCVPRFRPRTARSSDRSRSSGVGIEGSASPKRPGGCSMIFLAERPPFTHACFPAAAAVGAGEGCWKSGSWDAGDPAVSEAGGLVSRCISLARVLAVPNVSPVRVSKIGLLSFKSLM